jgi:diguanylate cyclase (GGDEF)-like protein
MADESSAKIERMHQILNLDYEVLTAADGAAAVDVAIEQMPDLILLDLATSGMNGFDICKRLKSEPRTAETPVLFVSDSNEDGIEAGGLKAGASDFIFAPFSDELVKARVKNHLELKRQRDVLCGYSYLDGLTGLSNRSRFDQTLNQEWRRGQRSRSPLSLILMDVDHFKSLNEAAGRRAGDDYLRQIALGLEISIHRAGDLVARYGGEKFVAVLADTDAEGAMGVAEKIQESVAALGLPHPNSEISPVITLSLGVVTRIAAFGEEPDAFVEDAKRALAKAKESGRNRIVVWNEDPCTSCDPVVSEQ